MTYTEVSHIKTILEVEEFFKYLVSERMLSFHPDDRFEDYFNYETKEPSFTTKEITLYNRLTDECFDVCEKTGTDIYNVGCKFLMEETELNRISA